MSISGLAANITVYENHNDSFSGNRYEIFSNENTEDKNDINNNDINNNDHNI